MAASGPDPLGCSPPSIAPRRHRSKLAAHHLAYMSHTEHWATDDLAMDELTRLGLAERTWAIENYHQGLKQCCGAERCQARAGRAQRNHIGMSIRAFLRRERYFYATGVSWY